MHWAARQLSLYTMDYGICLVVVVHISAYFTQIVRPWGYNYSGRMSFFFFFFYLVISLYLLNNILLAAVYDAYKVQLRVQLQTFYRKKARDQKTGVGQARVDPQKVQVWFETATLNSAEKWHQAV